MPDEPERSDLEAFVRGDEPAFERVFRLFESDVYRWILRIVRRPDAAEDVLIESFWRAYRGRARFDPSRSFGAWMRRIATNAALDHLRGTRPDDARGTRPDQLAATPAPDHAVAQSLAQAFQRLSPRLRIVATLALIEQRPYGEIADALNVPIGTVKSRVSRATDALRKELARLGLRP